MWKFTNEFKKNNKELKQNNISKTKRHNEILRETAEK